MTLLDAPQFDFKRSRRKLLIVQCSAGAIVLILLSAWLVASRPVDWPWNWSRYFFGRAAVNRFLGAVEADDLPRAYGVWVHDPDWEKHPQQYATYPYSRFMDDWSATSPDNEYGPIRNHRIAEAARYGQGLLVAVLFNGRKSDALDLSYDPKSGQLSFAPPGVSLYLGP
ncbi:MAG: hypothetical protein WBP85_16140 [Terracidiphilus sp.]